MRGGRRGFGLAALFLLEVVQAVIGCGARVYVAWGDVGVIEHGGGGLCV